MNREPSFVINELLGRVNRGELSRRTFVKAAGILGLSAGMSQMLLDGRAQAMQDSGASSGELVIALPRSLISLDPHGAQSVEEATAIVNAHLLDTLTYRDAASGEILPRIAESWEQVDELTWSFTVRSGITFHDGTPVTSADLKASLDRVLELAGPLAPLWATVESTEAPDDQTFVIKTTSPTGTVPTSATLLYITPAAAATDEAFFEAPIGAGPYKFVSWTRDSEMVCEAVADHWDGAPGIAKLTFRDIPEVAARSTSLETGEIDITWALPADQLPTLRENSDLTIDSTSTYAYYFIWFNASREPFTDVRVRQAMWHALDIETMAADLLQDVGVPASAPIPSTVFGHATQTPYAYDPELAKSLLAEAGYPDGFDTHIIWVADSGPQDRELLEVALSYWAAIGVRVEKHGAGARRLAREPARPQLGHGHADQHGPHRRRRLHAPPPLHVGREPDRLRQRGTRSDPPRCRRERRSGGARRSLCPGLQDHLGGRRRYLPVRSDRELRAQQPPPELHGGAERDSDLHQGDCRGVITRPYVPRP
ncbi:MAG: ABC transporter substrate-binding protein [Thermomicrobiales bacterium]